MTRIAHLDTARFDEAGCSWVSQQLSRYLDGELTVAASDRVHGHLEHCDSCQLALEEEASLVALTVDQLIHEEPNQELEQRLIAALAAENSTAHVELRTPVAASKPSLGPAHIWGRQTWGSAAAAILLFAVAWILSTDSAEQPTVAPEPTIEIATSEPAETLIRTNGDVNGDGTTGLNDVELFARYMTDQDVAIPCEALADVDESGSLTLSDLAAVTHEQVYATGVLLSFRTVKTDDRLPCDDDVACLN